MSPDENKDSSSSPPSRRTFLLASGAAVVAAGAAIVSRFTNAPALLGLDRKSGPRISGGWVNESAALGHRLRDGASMPTPRRIVRVPAVAVGGGIAGLSAAWQLERHGFRDYVLLEMERDAGGNARGGENAVSRYPWAAHYVPVPGPRATLVRELFRELGVLTDTGWDERTLCFAPQERLFVHGEWQSGLDAELLGSHTGRDELHRFDDLIAEQRRSGEFTIPMALGARAGSALDRMSFAHWLDAAGLRSPAMRWYAEYGTRDDYGASTRDTSAWAGVHYHAAREPTEQGPLTWPEGNTWIARRLAARVGTRLITGTPVHRILSNGRKGWRVRAGDAEYLCDDVIFAAPTFLTPYIVEGMRAPGFVYSPWLVANLTLDRWPEERGVPPAWDNVLRSGVGLGYVVATHQALRAREDGPTVWTYYCALTTRDPATERRVLQTSTWSDWVERIMMELAVAHPNIRRCVTHVDIVRLGHAMVRPTVAFLGADARRDPQWAPRGIHLAHSDLSGLSLFEEAQYRGVVAADAVLASQHRR
ncbi:MAG: twin-arginine translocation pathway signal protein [Gemmatimonadetes bacterium]|nr:MAG: twin-arginine translocation pathway signal protein [Gemmatimonadota bacterium]